ncbi:TetR family transcriptional regulator [uncultured Cellulomonas sp.]|uniref:TetR/AcrR family transcriptional regulator n=1 Tax=uncultured Cellulomonas sp. TaxID=189682 RepID=UPI0028EF0F7B|nr:TetR family transcriptional regulator [uncultured Cellulomonas sp.]
MARDVNGAARPYRSAKRAEQAAATRSAVVRAARHLFLTEGYGGTTVAAVAARAQVAVDTVYTAVGRKPALLREVVETSISGTDHAVPAEQRGYVRRIQEATTARAKIEIYAHAVADIQGRLGPVYLALREAAATDADCRELWEMISARRAANMRDLVADLRRTGELRTDLDDDEMADVVWSMNGPEYWALLVHERGWSTERFAARLADTWIRTLTTAG